MEVTPSSGVILYPAGHVQLQLLLSLGQNFTCTNFRARLPPLEPDKGSSLASALGPSRSQRGAASSPSHWASRGQPHPLLTPGGERESPALDGAMAEVPSPGPLSLPPAPGPSARCAGRVYTGWVRTAPEAWRSQAGLEAFSAEEFRVLCQALERLLRSLPVPRRGEAQQPGTERVSSLRQGSGSRIPAPTCAREPWLCPGHPRGPKHSDPKGGSGGALRVPVQLFLAPPYWLGQLAGHLPEPDPMPGSAAGHAGG